HVVHEAVTVGPYYVHNVDSAMLLHAEAGAFGGGAGADLQLLAYPTDFPDSAARLPLREISARFFDFIAIHADLYQGLRSYAEVGIVFHDNSREILGSHPEHHSETFALAKALAGRGVLWDVLSEKTVTPVNMARF